MGGATVAKRSPFPLPGVPADGHADVCCLLKEVTFIRNTLSYAQETQRQHAFRGPVTHRLFSCFDVSPNGVTRRTLSKNNTTRKSISFLTLNL